MDNLTLNLIYALKQRRFEKGTLIEEAIAFLSEYTITPPQYYTDSEMERISQMVFVEYLRTARNPAFEVERFFEIQNRHRNTTLAILECLRNTQVRDEHGFINGFREGDKDTYIKEGKQHG